MEEEEIFHYYKGHWFHTTLKLLFHSHRLCGLTHTPPTHVPHTVYEPFVSERAREV